MIQDTPNPRLITVLHPHSEANGGAIEYLLTTHGFVGTVEDASELRGFSNSVDNNELQCRGGIMPGRRPLSTVNYLDLVPRHLLNGC